MTADEDPKADLWTRARAFRARYQVPHGLFWIRRVNHTAGAFIAMLLVPTPVTPNLVTVGGLVVHVVGAAVVATMPSPAPAWAAILVMLVWQLAFSLDCADGTLARARGTTSSFGAWFDQIVDSFSRTAVYVSLILFLIRALALRPAEAALLAGLSVALALIQTFASWERSSLIGGRSPIADTGRRAAFVLRVGQQLVDYGAFLFVVALLLLVPPLLLIAVIASAAVNALFVAAQVALAWRRHVRA
ncbi:MAG: CDP-alcohol phosphatidyltransferase family protein [Chloroflexota bacterium]|nr:CDP-alcohol phosphatidyltransferase family protein [Chloroflexota bacterium]